MEECGDATKCNEMDAKKKTFIEAMKTSLGNITKACEALGINRTTYYRWLEDEEFKSEIDNIGEYVIDFAEHSLFRQIQENNTTATIFYLKTKGKHRGYVEKQEIDHSGSLGIVWKEEKTYETKDDK